MLLGITGTDGSGKGKTVWETVLEGCQIFFEFSKKNIDNLNSNCKQVSFLRSFGNMIMKFSCFAHSLGSKSPVPGIVQSNDLNQIVC